ncbi:MAG: glycosyltransferase [Proteobacteria bacterium]|nr:glycosyltransferase [Pseudomonadota bacterium]
MDSRVGVVVIGRNERSNLETTLASALAQSAQVLYVDSGSTDGSAPFARSKGVATVELDDSVPHTAARGRNAGLAWLLEHRPEVRFVQFLDGDTALCPGWLAHAVEFLSSHPRYAVVAGQLREREPDRNVYHRLADMEWRATPGPTESVGGNAMMTVEALQQVEGFRQDIAAGEEFELCARIRAAGWSVMQLSREMATHDIGMERLGQWWTRCVRHGVALARQALNAEDHSQMDRHRWTKKMVSALTWGGLVPLTLVSLPLPLAARATALCGAYGWLGGKIARAQRAKGWDESDSMLYAASCVAGKLPEAAGVMSFAAERARGIVRAGTWQAPRASSATAVPARPAQARNSRARTHTCLQAAPMRRPDRVART